MIRRLNLFRWPVKQVKSFFMLIFVIYINISFLFYTSYSHAALPVLAGAVRTVGMAVAEVAIMYVFAKDKRFAANDARYGTDDYKPRAKASVHAFPGNATRGNNLVSKLIGISTLVLSSAFIEFQNNQDNDLKKGVIVPLSNTDKVYRQYPMTNHEQNQLEAIPHTFGDYDTFIDAFKKMDDVEITAYHPVTEEVFTGLYPDFVSYVDDVPENRIMDFESGTYSIDTNPDTVVELIRPVHAVYSLANLPEFDTEDVSSVDWNQYPYYYKGTLQTHSTSKSQPSNRWYIIEYKLPSDGYIDYEIKDGKFYPYTWEVDGEDVVVPGQKQIEIEVEPPIVEESPGNFVQKEYPKGKIYINIEDDILQYDTQYLEEIEAPVEDGYEGPEPKKNRVLKRTTSNFDLDTRKLLSTQYNEELHGEIINYYKANKSIRYNFPQTAPQTNPQTDPASDPEAWANAQTQLQTQQEQNLDQLQQQEQKLQEIADAALNPYSQPPDADFNVPSIDDYQNHFDPLSKLMPGDPQGCVPFEWEFGSDGTAVTPEFNETMVIDICPHLGYARDLFGFTLFVFTVVHVYRRFTACFNYL